MLRVTNDVNSCHIGGSVGVGVGFWGGGSCRLRRSQALLFSRNVFLHPSAQIQEQTARSWMAGCISRQAAEEILNGPQSTDGSFLVRESEKKPGAFSLSMRSVQHPPSRRARGHPALPSSPRLRSDARPECARHCRAAPRSITGTAPHACRGGDASTSRTRRAHLVGLSWWRLAALWLAE